jgi:hypothetical protein
MIVSVHWRDFEPWSRVWEELAAAVPRTLPVVPVQLTFTGLRMAAKARSGERTASKTIRDDAIVGNDRKYISKTVLR